MSKVYLLVAALHGTFFAGFHLLKSAVAEKLEEHSRARSPGAKGRTAKSSGGGRPCRTRYRPRPTKCVMGIRAQGAASCHVPYKRNSAP